MAGMFEDLIPAGGSAQAETWSDLIPAGGTRPRIVINTGAGGEAPGNGGDAAAAPVAQPQPAASPVQQQDGAPALSQLSAREREILIRTVLGEADAEPDDGQRAVAAVILNRLKSGQYGPSVAKVVTAKNQFEPWMNPDARKRMLGYAPDSPEYQRAAANIDALLGGEAEDPTGGALNFFAPGAQAALGRQPPAWANGREPVVIGKHNFYRPADQPNQKVRVASNDTNFAPKAAPVSFDDLIPPAGSDAGPTAASAPAPATFGERFSGEGIGVPGGDAEKLAGGLRKAADEKLVGPSDFNQKADTFNADMLNTFLLNAPRNLKAAIWSQILGRPFNDVYEELKSREEAKSRQNPISSGAGTGAGIAASMAVLPEVKIAEGATMGGRALNAAATGAGYGAASELLDSKDPVKASVAAALGGALGGVASPVAEKVIGLVSKMVAAGKAATTFLKADGTLSDDALAAAKEAGIDPSVLETVMQKKYAETFQRKGATPATAREAAADEFGIKLTPGEATSDYGKIAAEQGMARDARGPLAGNEARKFYGEREGQITQAKEGVQTRVSKRPDLKEIQEILDAAPASPMKDRIQAMIDKAQPQVVDSVNDAANLVAQGARSKAGIAKGQYKRAYDDALNREGEFSDLAFRDIGERIRRDSLKAPEPVIIDDVTTPVSARAIQHLDNTIGKLKIQDRAEPRSMDPVTWGEHQWPGEPERLAGAISGPDTIAGVNLKGVDQARKQLVSFYKAAKSTANDSDIRAMRRIIAGFDDELETAISVGLFNGDDQALPALKRARALFADYQKTFRSQGAGDAVGKAMEKIVERNATGSEIANMLYGKAAIGEKGDAVRLAAKLKNLFGENSEEWSAIRQGLWLRLSSQPEGVTDFGPQALSTRISKFLSGDGADMAKVMFLPQELAEMRRFATVMKTITPPVGTVNHSGTYYALARELGVGGVLGGTAYWLTGDPVTGAMFAGAKMGGKLGREVYRGRATRKYFQSGAPKVSPAITRVPGIGAAAGATAGQAL